MKQTMKKYLAVMLAVMLALPTFALAETPAVEFEADGMFEAGGPLATDDIFDTSGLLTTEDINPDLPDLNSETVRYCFLVEGAPFIVLEVEKGDEITRPDDPTPPEGMAFDGWALADGTRLFEDGAAIVAGADPLTPEVAIYARFVRAAEEAEEAPAEEAAEVVFDTGDGDGDGVATAETPAEQSEAPAAEAPVEEAEAPAEEAAEAPVEEAEAPAAEAPVEEAEAPIEAPAEEAEAPAAEAPVEEAEAPAAEAPAEEEAPAAEEVPAEEAGAGEEIPVAEEAEIPAAEVAEAAEAEIPAAEAVEAAEAEFEEVIETSETEIAFGAVEEIVVEEEELTDTLTEEAALADAITTWDALQDAIRKASSGDTITLGGNITADADDEPISIKKNLTLNLAGYTLNRGLTEAKDNGNVITVSQGAALTITDSSVDQDNPVGKGKITGGKTTGEGGGIVIYGTLKLEGGTITGNTAKKGLDEGAGGGVYADKGSKFVMEGGKISDNEANVGGGLYINSSNEANTISGGEISDNRATYGGGVNLSVYCRLTLSGGKISGNRADSWGGGVLMSTNSVLTITGGTIGGADPKDKNYANKEGGGIYNIDGTINLSGGSIIGNEAHDYGGGIFMGYSGEFNMSGGKITNNTAGTNGGGIYAQNNITLRSGDNEIAISGNKLISSDDDKETNNNVCFKKNEGKFIIKDGTAPKIKGTIGVALNPAIEDGNVPYTIASNGSALGTNPEKYFTSEAVQYGVKYDNENNVIYLYKWTEWAALQDALARGGIKPILASDYDFDLSGDIKAGSTETMLVVPDNVTATLDLDGITIDRGLTEAVENGNVITVNGELTILDSSTAKTGKITGGNNTDNGGGVAVAKGGKFTMSGGAISDNNAKNYGGGVYNYEGCTFTLSGSGTISGNTAASQGGGVCSLGTFSLSGNGAIRGNTVSNGDGGGVWSGTTGIITMTGGEISGNFAQGQDGTENGNGGGVFNHGAFTLSGGTISGNTADRRGGGVQNSIPNSSEYKFTMSGGAISGNNVPGGYGGGVYNSNGTFELTDGYIGGTAAADANNASFGGGVLNDATFNMAGGAIRGNTAASQGGGVYNHNGVFTLSGGAISSNSAVDAGGGAYLQEGELVMNNANAEISGNTANNYGGGVFMNDKNAVRLTLSAGKINENSAKKAGGGVYTYRDITLSGAASIVDNEADNTDSNVALVWRGESNAAKIKVTETLTNGPIGVSYVQGSGSDPYDFIDDMVFTAGSAEKLHDSVSSDFVSEQDGYAVAKNGDGEAKLTNEWKALQAAIDAAKDWDTVNARDYDVSGDGKIVGGLANSALQVSGEKTVTLDLSNGTEAITLDRGLNRAVENGNVITVQTGNTLILTGDGCITGGNNTFNGGGIVNNGALIMESGTIRGNLSAGNGGGVYNAGFFTLNQGQIKGNIGITNGGGVYNGADTTFSMNGGTVGGDEDNDLNVTIGNGGGVYSASELVQMAVNASIIGNSAGGNGGGVFITGNRATFSMTENAVIRDNRATADGGGLYSEGTNTYLEMRDNAVISGNSANGNGGGAFVTGDTAELLMRENAVISDNDGHDGGGVFVGRGAMLSMYDSATVTGNHAPRGGGGGVYVGYDGQGEETATLVVDNTASIVGNNAQDGGGVYMQKHSVFDMRQAAAITGNTATGNGGGVFTEGVRFDINRPFNNRATRSANVQKATISGNRANNNGGGVYVKAGETGFVMNDDSVVSGNNANNGGGVWNAGVFEMNGTAEISENNANNGGGVYNQATSNMAGSATIHGNNANNGGGVYNEGTFTQENGAIRGNTASHEGGGVQNWGVMNLSGGAISNNKADTGDGGGVACRENSTFDMTGGEISYNEAVQDPEDTWFTGNGGGIYAYDLLGEGAVTLSGGSIHHNRAARGAGVYTTNSQVLNMKGTVAVTDNTASEKGGGVFINTEAVNMEGNVKISGNTADGKASDLLLRYINNIEVFEPAAVINVTGALAWTKDNPIGVSYDMPDWMEEAEFPNWIVFTRSLPDNGDDTLFTSQQAGYGVGLSTAEPGEALLGKNCPIAFAPNGGKGAMDPVSFVSGSSGKVKLPKSAFTYDGHSFKAWTSEYNGAVWTFADEAEIDKPLVSEFPGDPPEEASVDPATGVTMNALWYNNVRLTSNSATVTYDGAEHTVTGYTASVKDVTFAGVSAGAKGTEAGEYAVKFTGVTVNQTIDTTGNYMVTELAEGKLTIESKPVDEEHHNIVIELNPTVYTYDGKAKTPDVTVKDGNTVIPKNEYTVTFRDNVNAGAAKAVITDVAGGNYAVNGEKAFTIKRKPLTVTAKAAGKVYGENDPALAYAQEGLVDAGDLSGALTRDPGEDVGSYAITQGTLKATDNYELTYQGAALTITTKPLNPESDTRIIIELNPSVYTYDGKAKTPDVTVKDGDRVVPASEYKVTYKDNVNAGTAVAVITDAEGGNYEVSGEKTFTIKKRPLTVTAKAASKVYGEKDPALTYAQEGLVDAKDLTGALTRARGENVGSYAITQGTLKATDNYELKYKGAKLTIKRKHLDDEHDITIGLKPTSYIYNGTAREPRVTVKDGDRVVPASEYKVTYKDNVNAGTAVAVISDVKGGNYIVSGEKTFTIHRREVTVTAKDQTVKQGGRLATGTGMAKLSGQVKGHALSAVKLTGNTAKVTASGKVNASGAKLRDAAGRDVTQNYRVRYVAGKLTVKKDKEPQPVKPDYMLFALLRTRGTNRLRLTWTKVPDAEGYDVFFRRCGNEFSKKPYASVSAGEGLRYDFTVRDGLKDGREFKAYVRAWKMDGKVKKYIGQGSPVVHSVVNDGNSSWTNVRTIKAAPAKLSLKKGGKGAIKVTVKGVKGGGRKPMSHQNAPLRYYSSNANVATVNGNGVVKGVAPGRCAIYVIANNGERTAVTVNVK